MAVPIGLLFDFVAVHIIGERAADADVRVNRTFTDSGSDWTMWVRHGVLNAREGHVDDVQLTLGGPKPASAQLLLQPGDAAEAIAGGTVAADGDTSVLETRCAHGRLRHPRQPRHTLISRSSRQPIVQRRGRIGTLASRPPT